MKKVLFISNQRPNSCGIGNPIITRILKSFARETNVLKVDFLPFENTIRSLWKIRKESRKYDVVHIHFGGLYALAIILFLIGVKTYKIITFHGTDIHAKSLKTTKSIVSRLKIYLNQKASFLSICLYDKCGVVAKEMFAYIPQRLRENNKEKFFIQLLGVDYETFTIKDKRKAQDSLNLQHGHYVLFSDISNTTIKRRDIASDIVKELGTPYQLLIMSGVKSDKVPDYINACDFVILTSDEEGSPNIIREALALNKPFFSVDVGDAAIQLQGLTNSSIISRNPQEAAKVILKYIKRPYIDNTRATRHYKLNIAETNKSIIQLYMQS